MGSIIPKEGVDISVALTANDPAKVPQLIREIGDLEESATSGDELARLQLAETARSLVRALETPRETMIKHCWAQPSVYAAIEVGVDIGLFKKLAEAEGPQNANELAKELKVDPPLLCRLMRHLGSMGYLNEVGADEYEATNFAKALSIPIICAGYPCVGGGLSQCLFRFHEYCKARDYQTPSSLNDGVLQWVYDTKLNMFEHLHAHQPYGINFNQHMAAYRQGRPSWMDPGFYPVQERLIDGAKTIDTTDKEAETPAFLVDVGGGIGHDIDEFRRKVSEIPGRLVLQDLPMVLEQIVELDSRIERQAYDFHTPQMVTGSRAYYMHSVLHDWPDEESAKILEVVKKAMTPGYSRLLINENVIPVKGANWESTALDIMMLTLLSSRERTEADWRHLLEDMAGLKITNIYTAANGVESILECELA